jgi:hypothetical protein
MILSIIYLSYLPDEDLMDTCFKQQIFVKMYSYLKRDFETLIGKS